MNYRQLGDTELKISELSFGTWAIGGAWGSKNDAESMKGLEKAMAEGVNFFDTADVYGDGHSETLLKEATKGKEDEIYLASKFCRAGDIHSPKTYSKKQVKEYLAGTLSRTGRERIDLYQIHCPPIEIINDGEVFQVLDDLKQEGLIRHYGVSVESVEEGLAAMNYPNVKALQVIFNIFRQKPVGELFPAAQEKGVGILARVPLASGLLTGKFKANHTFEKDDHRTFNRDGQLFNAGETFAGLPFEKGVELSQKLDWIKEDRESMTAAALRWILEHDAVTAAIPGFKHVGQVESNLKAVDVKPFSPSEMDQLTRFYEEQVHDHIRGAY